MEKTNKIVQLLKRVRIDTNYKFLTLREMLLLGAIYKTKTFFPYYSMSVLSGAVHHLVKRGILIKIKNQYYLPDFNYTKRKHGDLVELS